MEEYCLKSTNDSTDRTAEIVTLLNKYGVCRLGVGKFYVKNLIMPEESSIMGEGNATKVYLSDDVENGFAIRIQSYCTVKDFYLLGDEDTIELSGEDVLKFDGEVPVMKKRHGIVWYGNYTKTFQTEKAVFPISATVSGMYISRFNGGGITHCDTGYSIRAGLNVSNCTVWNCHAGINIAYWSEFNRYTNVACNNNYYGLINNGGNNVFINCGFSSNVCGVLMDNADGKKRNNSHGDMIGCTIDHADKNKGVGIKVINMNVGYHFIGCQVMFSQIELVDSSGLTFQNINFKNDIITVRGGGKIIFSNCICTKTLTFDIKDNDKVQVIDCYSRDGENKIEI